MAAPTDPNSDQVQSAQGTSPSGFGVASRSDALVTTGGLPQVFTGAALPTHTSRRPAILHAAPKPIDLIRALQRRWLLALCLAVVAAIPPAIIAWFMVPLTYTATAWLQIRTGPMLYFDTKLERNESKIGTHVQLIQSRFVSAATLRQKGMDRLPWIVEQKNKGVDPSEWLAKQVRVRQPKNTNLMTIEMSGEDPGQLTKLVNGITDAYLESVVDKERHDLLKKRELMEQQHLKRTDELRLLRERMNVLRDRINVKDEETATVKEKLLMDLVMELRRQANLIRGDVLAKKREIAFLKRTLNADGDGKITVTDEMLAKVLERDEEYQRLLIHREALRNSFDTTKKFAKPGTQPKVLKSLTAQLENTNSELKKRENAAREALQKLIDGGELVPNAVARLRALEDQLAGLQEAYLATVKEFEDADDELTSLSQYSSEFERYQEKALSLKEVTGAVGLELAKLEMELSGGLDRVKLLEKAVLPRNADRGRRNKIAGGAALLGAALAFLGVAMIEFHTRRLTSSEDMQDGLGVGVLGDVPLLSQRRWGFGGSSNGALQGIMDESIDSIRAMLLHSAEGESLRVLMVTSAKSGEGKTTVASSLAASLGRSGRRTLLIDGDLRRPSVHRLLELPLENGLAEVLRDEASVEEVIRPSRASGLWVMSAGVSDHETLQSLTSEKVGQIFERLRSEFDFVVVDTGPIMAVVDPLLLGQYCDGAILSVVRRVSQITQVYEASERLKTTGIRILGCVVNGINRSPFGAFGYYGYGYGYGYGNGYSQAPVAVNEAETVQDDLADANDSFTSEGYGYEEEGDRDPDAPA